MFDSNSAACSFLTDRFVAPGQLNVVDLVSGKSYQQVTVDDPQLWAAAHHLGPRSEKPAVVNTVDGDRVTSYFRSFTLPLDEADSTSFVAVEFREQYCLAPTPAIEAFSDLLSEMGIPHYADRSFSIGRWTMWVFFPRRVTAGTARDFAKRLYHSARDRGLVDVRVMSLPILEKHPEAIEIPMHFFGAGFLGRLHTSSRHFHETDVSCLATYDPTTDEIKFSDYGEDPEDAAVGQLVTAWWRQHTARKKRAGGLMELLISGKIALSVVDNEPSAHSKRIALGRLLLRYEGDIIAGHTLHARSSGNSKVYWLS
jgi:hypothetical protein